MQEFGIRITLTKEEAEEAAATGLKRWHTSAFRGDRNRMSNQSLSQNVGSHIAGAYGERAVYKALGKEWDGPVDTFKAPDVTGTQIQVRTATKPDGKLVVRERDNGDQPFVLVVPEQFPTFRVVGWCYGREAKTQENWGQPVSSLPPAWFQPQHKLKAIDTLPNPPQKASEQ